MLAVVQSLRYVYFIDTSCEKQVFSCSSFFEIYLSFSERIFNMPFHCFSKILDFSRRAPPIREACILILHKVRELSCHCAFRLHSGDMLTRRHAQARSTRANTPARGNREDTPVRTGSARTTPARATRARGGRRAATAATAATAAIVDDEVVEESEVLSKPNQAYGTTGKLVPLEEGVDDQAAAQVAALPQADANPPVENANSSGLTPVAEEDEEENVGEKSDNSPSSSEPRQRKDSGAGHGTSGGIKAKSAHVVAEQGRVASAPAQSGPETERSRFFSFWAPRNGQLDVPNVVFAHQHNLFSRFSTLGFILTVLLLSALSSFIFEALRGPVLNPLRFNSVNNTSVNSAGIVQQVLHSTSRDITHLNSRIATLEQQLQNLPQELAVTPKHQVDWFTPGFGAKIDEFLTSPTAAICVPTWSPWPWNIAWGQSCLEEPVSGPPTMALEKWNDPAWDRWCAPTPPHGKLQLTVNLERMIAPTELVVEYVAKDAAPVGHMKSAPREVQLWIQVINSDSRSKLGEMIDRLYPDLWTDSNTQGRELAAAQTLGYGYLPVGRWFYDINTQQEAQTLRIPLPLHEYGIKTSSVAVRVNSNWGDADFTCINRLRLHGVDASGITERLEEAIQWPTV